MQEAIRYIFVGIGIGVAAFGLWALYCISQFSKRGNDERE